jgi:hypothetical protein
MESDDDGLADPPHERTKLSPAPNDTGGRSPRFVCRYETLSWRIRKRFGKSASRSPNGRKASQAGKIGTIAIVRISSSNRRSSPSDAGCPALDAIAQIATETKQNRSQVDFSNTITGFDLFLQLAGLLNVRRAAIIEVLRNRRQKAVSLCPIPRLPSLPRLRHATSPENHWWSCSITIRTHFDISHS